MQIKLEHPACLPTRSNPTDAGLDLRCKQTTTLQMGKRTLVATGVSVKIPVNHVGLLFPRSSLSKQGITMTNSVGVIDSDYRGEILASLVFNGVPGSLSETEIPAGERIVQLVVVPILLPELEVGDWSDELWNDTQRGTGGFGSTGKA
jgi:dUTP pyrophosphatase